MNKGLKWHLMSAIVFAAGCVYLASGPSALSHVSSNSACPVVTSGETMNLSKAPSEDQLALRTRRLWRRAYRKTA
jgi:hypothetical protein